MYIKKSYIKNSKRWIPIGLVTTILLLVSSNFVGCETEDWTFEVNCNDCYSIAPDSAKLIVHLTINATYDSVPLTFYRGAYEEGVIDWQDTATSDEFLLFSEMEREYTVKATYSSGNNTIFAIDGDKMQLRDADEECGSPCYIVKGGIFDVRLIEPN